MEPELACGSNCVSSASKRSGDNGGGFTVIWLTDVRIVKWYKNLLKSRLLSVKSQSNRKQL